VVRALRSHIFSSVNIKPLARLQAVQPRSYPPLLAIFVGVMPVISPVVPVDMVPAAFLKRRALLNQVVAEKLEGVTCEKTAVSLRLEPSLETKY